MGRKRTPGLVKRGGAWYVDKRIGGRRVCQSTGTRQLAEAEQFLARLTEQDREAQVYGVRPSRTFEQAAARFLLENQHKRSLGKDAILLKQLMPWIGQVPLDGSTLGRCSPGSSIGAGRAWRPGAESNHRHGEISGRTSPGHRN